MNQENNFNTQSNNQISNNQSLQNNQGFNDGFNQSMQSNIKAGGQSFNGQPQSTQNYQQPINQMNTMQTASQPMNSFESGNVNDGNINKMPQKKKNLRLMIAIVIVVLVIITIIIIFNVSKGNDKNNSEPSTNELYTYSDLFNNSGVFESSLCMSIDNNKYKLSTISNNLIILNFNDNGHSYRVSIGEYESFDDSALFHYGLNYDENNIKTILNDDELKFKIDTNGKTYLNGSNDYVHYCNYDYLHNGKIISIYGSICDPIENYSQEKIEQIKSIFVDKDNCVNVFDKLARISFLSEYYIKDTKRASISQDDISLSFKNYGIGICMSENDCYDWTTANYLQQKKYGNLEISWLSIEHDAKLLVKNITTNEELIFLISDGTSTAPTIDESYSIFNQIFIKK